MGHSWAIQIGPGVISKARELQREKILLTAMRPSRHRAIPTTLWPRHYSHRNTLTSHPRSLSYVPLKPHRRLPQPPCRLPTSPSPVLSSFLLRALPQLCHCHLRFTSLTVICIMHAPHPNLIHCHFPRLPGFTLSCLHYLAPACRRSPWPRFFYLVIFPTSHVHS
jgi:hypothetical protein